MIVTKQVQETVTKTVVEDIVCNKCGKSLRTEIGNYEGLVEAVVQGGYDSPVVGDMVSWIFSVCEHCLDDYRKTFKIPVFIRDGMGFGRGTDDEDDVGDAEG